jgi:hypothetical protein
MKTSSRDKLILMLLPAVLIGLGWWYWFRPTAQWNELQAAVVTARQAVPAPEAVAAQQKKLNELTAASQRLAAQQASGMARWTRLRQQYEQPLDHADMTRQVTDILRAHSLVPLTALHADTRRELQDGTLGKLVVRLKRPMGDLIPELAPPKKAAVVGSANTPEIEKDLGLEKADDRMLWVIEFAGYYGDVQSALEELAQSPLAAIPMLLVMDEAKTDISLRKWTLVVWL